MGIRSVTQSANHGGGGGRKSTADHIKNGTYRPSRHGPARRGGCPRKVIRIPDPPADAPPLFRQVWHDTARILDPLRIVTEADLAAFELLVQSLSLCADAYARIYNGVRPDRNALVFDLPFKDGVKRTATPEVGILVQAQKLAAYHLSRFGLTPADRARVDAPAPESAPPGQDVDPLDEFLPR